MISCGRRDDTLGACPRKMKLTPEGVDMDKSVFQVRHIVNEPIKRGKFPEYFAIRSGDAARSWRARERQAAALRLLPSLNCTLFSKCLDILLWRSIMLSFAADAQRQNGRISGCFACSLTIGD
jgi:hypothetical protein